jgi:flagellar motor switch protein FliM
MADTSNVLSQDEVNALLKAVETGELAIKKETGPKKSCQKYDFRNPSLISKESKGMLKALHENFARDASLNLSTFLRTLVQVKLSAIEQVSYNEFIFSLPEVTCLNIVSFAPFKGNAVMEINTTILVPFIERLLGGEHKGFSQDRPLTEIELAISRKIVRKILEDYKLAWQTVALFNPAVDSVETDPRFVQVVKGEEKVVLITFELAMGSVSGIMSICLPSLIFEALTAKISLQSGMMVSKPKVKEISHALRLRDVVLDVPFHVSSILDRTHLTIEEVLSLKSGDIIKLNRQVSPDIHLELDNKPHFGATLSIQHNRKIVYITQKY